MSGLVVWIAIPDSFTVASAPDGDDPDGPEFQIFDTGIECNAKPQNWRPGLDFLLQRKADE